MNNTPLSLGLLGYPVSHSFSPLLHNTALRDLGLAGEYRLLPAPEEHMIFEYCLRMRKGLIHGLNITIPWKIKIINYLDQLTEAASEIGAVNTVYFKDHQLIGENTDAQGFQEDIDENFGKHLMNSSKKALLLGAGGAARAVAWSLCKSGWAVTVAAQRISQALEIKEHFSMHHYPLRAVSLSKSHLAKLSPDLLINATPVGMAPDEEAIPWPEDLALPKETIVYDLIYNPPTTKFLSTAQKNGLRSINGTGMLVSQAAASFKRWTGIQPPKNLMSETLSEALENLKRRST